MSQLNIKDLYSTINKKTLQRMEIYDQTLQKCHKRIVYHSSMQRTYCFFQIPEFIIGVPLFDHQEMKTYMINSLKTNGFQILYIDPNWLFISWEKKGSRILIENGAKDNKPKKINKPTNQFKPIDSFKPTGQFIYEDSSMIGFADKFK